jgi:hypothetical protein
MPDVSRNDPCPCGSGRKYKLCHGSLHPPRRPATPAAEPPAGAASEGLDNPFKRIFREDGSFDEAYVRSRMGRLHELLMTDEDFYGVRFDREEMEKILAERQDLFASAGSDPAYEEAYARFAELALPQLVTAEFDERAKELLGAVIHDAKVTPRDRSAAACGLIFTLPADGSAPPMVLHRNPLFDIVLRVTFNESMERIRFLRSLSEEKDLSEAEANARLSEFLRTMPALLYEIREGVNRLVRKAIKSYEAGEFSFGLGVDMALHGIRAVRQITLEHQGLDPSSFTEADEKRLSEKFLDALKDAFALDIAEEEQAEVLERMGGFLQHARDSGALKAAAGLSAAIGAMARHGEVARRLLFAAYHEAVTGSRIFRLPEEEETARGLFADPLSVAPYLAYGAFLEGSAQHVRAERVYRAALMFFPEDGEVRSRLAAVGAVLETARSAAVRAEILETERQEAEAAAEEAARAAREAGAPEGSPGAESEPDDEPDEAGGATGEQPEAAGGTS